VKKREFCIVDGCDEKATCFYFHEGGYLPFCLHHYSQYTNVSSIKNNVIEKKDINEYIWRK